MKTYVAYIDLKKVIEKDGFLWDDNGNVTLPEGDVPISFNFDREKVVGMGRVEWFDKEDLIVKVTLDVDDRFVPYIDTGAFSISPMLITDPNTMRLGITYDPYKTMKPYEKDSEHFTFGGDFDTLFEKVGGLHVAKGFELLEFAYIPSLEGDEEEEE